MSSNLTLVKTVEVVVPILAPSELWFHQWLNGVREGSPDDTTLSMRLDDDPLFQSANRVYILSRFTLFQEPSALDKYPPRSVVVVEHSVDSSWNVGQRADVNPDIYKHPAIRGVACTTKSMATFHRTRYDVPDSVPVIAVGFPYPSEDERLFIENHREPDPDLIVFPQRIADDADPLFAATISHDLISQGYRVVWSTPHPIHDKWPIDRWQIELGIDVRMLRGAEYRALLAEAAFAFSTVRPGGTWLSGYEAWLSGAIPVAISGVGCFSDPFELRIWPLTLGFDIENALRRFPAHGKRFQDLVDVSWYMPSQWWKRIGDIL